MQPMVGAVLSSDLCDLEQPLEIPNPLFLNIYSGDVC